ncbi:hypothetical protein I5F06_18445, partial [Proteus mirabilis]|nr:hypothetical protein [Proteus mirabilis]
MKINNKLSLTRNLFIIYAVVLTISLFTLSILYYLFGNEILKTNYSSKEIVFFTFSSWIVLLLAFPFFIYGWKKAILLLSKPFLHNTKTLPEINKQNNSLIDDIFKQYGHCKSKNLGRFLLIGTPTSIEKLTPNLTADIWQESN